MACRPQFSLWSCLLPLFPYSQYHGHTPCCLRPLSWAVSSAWLVLSLDMHLAYFFSPLFKSHFSHEANSDQPVQYCILLLSHDHTLFLFFSQYLSCSNLLNNWLISINCLHFLVEYKSHEVGLWHGEGFLFVCLFCSTGVWTQGLELGRQVFYHLSHTLSCFFFFCLSAPGWL
jgi:hypothetical protein